MSNMEELLLQLQSTSVSSFAEFWSACAAEAQVEELSKRPPMQLQVQQHQQQHLPDLQQHQQQPELQQPALQHELPSQLQQQSIVPDA